MTFPPQPTVGLTDRERQVLGLVADGHTDAEIAGMLTLSVYTVQNHVKSILRKLNARNRTQAGTIYHQANMTNSSH
ncbi:MAG: helix-turn-helix transcriptional regulator [Candidatus Promineofilum sp.]|uniref:response regulator transcription factor n=1 Tax=Promineifilum sp. TaxID=2664178 RepID=UPI0024120729|nr:helix-turn-helix transcriptional regulator [Promineifilum sp.]